MSHPWVERVRPAHEVPLADLRALLAEAVRFGVTARVAEMTPEQALDAVELLAVLRAAIAELATGGASSARVEASTAAGREDRLLTAEDVAERCACSVAWVYRQARHWPFARKLSHKVLRFSEAGLREYLAKRRRA